MSAGIPHVTGVAHEFVNAGGLRTHVATAGHGPPVVLLHGWPQHWYEWRDVIPLLAPHARVICPDLRGLGWTDVPRRGYEKDQLKRDVLALLDALELERVTFVGHDWGGFVGFLLALEHPERIESFLALNVLPPWPASNARTRLDAWRFIYIPILATRGLGGGRLGRGFAARGLRDAGLTPADVDAFVEQAGGRARARYRAHLSQLPAGAACDCARPLLAVGPDSAEPAGVRDRGPGAHCSGRGGHGRTGGRASSSSSCPTLGTSSSTRGLSSWPTGC